jgi:adenosylhomocysteine nucleosidase
MPKFVAIVALPSELPVDLWTFDEPIIFSGVGKLNASVATIKAIDQFKPEFVLNLGTVGSLNESISGVIEIGRVLQRDFDARPLSPKGQVPFDEKPQILTSAKGLFSCGTGDTFVLSKEDWLLENQIDVVDMELFAIAHACYSSNIPWRSFKFITDYISSESGEDWKRNLEQSGRALTRAVSEM